jgi:hypothetical protein
MRLTSWDFYAFEDEQDGCRDLEQPVSQIESVLAPIPAIEGGYDQFHPDLWQGLTSFVDLLWLRGPTSRDVVNALSP